VLEDAANMYDYVLLNMSLIFMVMELYMSQRKVFFILMLLVLVFGAMPAQAVPDGDGNEIFPLVNVGIGTTAPAANLQVGAGVPDAMQDTGSDLYVKGNVEVDGKLYGDGSTLSIAIDNLMDVTAPAPVKDQVLKWNGTAWVPAAYSASFTFSIASFTNNGGSTPVLIGTGTWKTAGSLTFSATYSNGPATNGYVSHSGWSNLTMTGTGFVGPTASTEAVSYPAAVGGTKVFTLYATDGAVSPTSAVTFTFNNKRFYGVSTITGGYTEANVEGLAGSEFNNNLGSTVFSVTAGPGEYIIFASRAALGDRTFTVGGFAGGFLAPETVSITNASGFTENYYVYRSVNANLGFTTVNVT
jgi:hypothetical protein